MQRTVLLAAILSLCLSAVAALGQESIELEGLHCVAWEDISGAVPSFAAPVSAAILMAWHAMNGYPLLLPDLNGDGRVDEADTIELAVQFAEPMQAQHGPVWDPFVVDTVAEYVASRYPERFQMLVYDRSIEEEYREHLGRAFDPADYPGIEILLLEDPRRGAYVEHLEHERPGVVGIGFEPEVNDFAVSRSAVLHEESSGWPVDLANASHDAFGPDPIWETMLRLGPDRWTFAHDGWTPFEIFIVLVPTREASGGTPTEDNPSDEPGDGPGGDNPTPGDEPGGSPGDEPGGEPGGTPSYSPDPGQEGACCLPDGSCSTLPQELCTRLGGTFFYGHTCQTLDCPTPSSGPCAEVEGDILYMCYAYEADGSITLQVTYQLVNNGPVDAQNIEALYIASIGHGTNAFSGSVWEYGITVYANGGTYTHTEYFHGPGNIPGVLRMYGGLWIQTSPPWDCFPIVDQDAVRVDEPAVRCDGDNGGPEAEPTPTSLPNLWVTNMTGCWRWSSDGQEHVLATVTGVVHNGGQAAASNIRARITAGGKSTTVTVGSLSAGGQKTVTATLDLGPYDTVSWPVQTSITADPTNAIAEADETNNTTSSAFPQSSDCN